MDKKSKMLMAIESMKQERSEAPVDFLREEKFDHKCPTERLPQDSQKAIRDASEKAAATLRVYEKVIPFSSLYDILTAHDLRVRGFHDEARVVSKGMRHRDTNSLPDVDI